MKIEPGKYYKTRDGRKVRIYATDGLAEYPIHGAVLNNNGWRAAMWDSSGSAYNNLAIQATVDIVSEWSDTPIVNWPAMPAWCNYVAMDEDGQWYAYIDKPGTDSEGWLPNNDYCFIPKKYHPTFTGDWKDSLAERE